MEKLDYNIPTLTGRRHEAVLYSNKKIDLTLADKKD